MTKPAFRKGDFFDGNRGGVLGGGGVIEEGGLTRLSDVGEEESGGGGECVWYGSTWWGFG